MKKIVLLFLLVFLSHNIYAQNHTFETYSSNNKDYKEFIL